MSNLITAIESDPTDPNNRRVYVNEACIATLHISNIEMLGIELDQQWTDELEFAIETMQANEKARSMALQLVSRRAWSKKELANRLIKRGCQSSIAKQITEELAEDGWLDDLAYAGACIREWLRVEPASRRWLTHKLFEKGISEPTASESIAEELGEGSEQDAATELAVIRIAKTSSLDLETARRRVIAALQRRGFSSDVASEAYRRAT